MMALVCGKCGSGNVHVEYVQTGARTSTKKKGCLHSMGRWLLIICTLGLWYIFGKKKSTSKTKMQNAKMAVCNNCGHSWAVR